MTEQAKGGRCRCGHPDYPICEIPTPPPAPEPAKAKDCRCASVMDGRGGMCPAHPCEPAPGPAKGGESCHHTFNMAGVCVNCGYDAATLAADHRYCSPEIEAEWNALKKERDREKARADGLERENAVMRQCLFDVCEHYHGEDCPATDEEDLAAYLLSLYLAALTGGANE
jgi:hypothetical protein